LDIPAYLDRINYSARVRPDLATLRGLHRAHMLSVPFENLDIVPLGHTIHLDEHSLWDKIVARRRGGFCYELNGLFASLLKQIGFEVTHLNARVFNHAGQPGIEFDHLVLLVRLPNGPKRYVADVGFGDSFTAPLTLEATGAQVQGLRAYRLEPIPAGRVLWQRNNDGTWARHFLFDLQPRDFPSDYEAGCRYHQTSSHSSFTHGSIASIATPNGRVTLEEERLIVTNKGRRQETIVAHHEQHTLLLKEYFGISLGSPVPYSPKTPPK
jgi:N-hydroxyarylamine O-acetyltransferase